MRTTPPDHAQNTTVPLPSLTAGLFALLLLTAGFSGLAGTAEADHGERGPCADPDTSSYRVDLSTGTENGNPIAFGAEDPAWEVQPPASNSWGSAWAIEPDAPGWFQPTDSRWINPYGEGTGENEISAPTGLYEYRLAFDVDPVATEKVVFDFQVVSDDGSDVAAGRLAQPDFLGQHAGHSGPPTGFQHTVYTGYDTYGLRINVTNAMAWTGLDVEGTAVVHCDEEHSPDESPCADGDRFAYDVDLSTGTDDGDRLAYGDEDPDWVSTERPNAGGDAPVYAIPPTPSSWYEPDEGRWINPWGDDGTNDNNAETGWYEYQLTFDVDPSVTDRIEFDFGVVSDDRSEIFVQEANSPPGIHLGTHTGHSGPPESFSATIPTGVSAYTLRIEVRNAIAWTGLYVNGTATVYCDDRHSPDHPCEGQDRFEVDVTTGRRNGTTDAFGDVDDDWIVTETPNSDDPEPPAYSVQPDPSWYPGSSGNWINPYGDQQYPFGHGNNRRDAPEGNYTYENTIQLDPSSMDQVAFSFRWTNDDSGFVELENGVGQIVRHQPGTNGHGTGSLQTVTWTVPVDTASYTIRVRAENVQTYTGIIVEGSAVVDCYCGESPLPGGSDDGASHGALDAGDGQCGLGSALDRVPDRPVEVVPETVADTGGLDALDHAHAAPLS